MAERGRGAGTNEVAGPRGFGVQASEALTMAEGNRQEAWSFFLYLQTYPSPVSRAYFRVRCASPCALFLNGSDILLTFPESEPTTRGQSEPSPVLPPKRADEFVSGSRLTLGTALAPTYVCRPARAPDSNEGRDVRAPPGGVDVPCACNPGSDRPGPEKPRAPTSASRSDGEHVGRRVR